MRPYFKPTPFNRGLLAVLGAVSLVFGVNSLRGSRPRLVTADPPPGAALDEPPSRVTLEFSVPIGGESSINVFSTIIGSAGGEQSYSGRSVTVESRIAPDDPEQKTLRAALEPGLPVGLYLVDWRVYPADGTSQRSGSFAFGVGMPAPTESTNEGSGALGHIGRRERGKRAAVLGGALFILLAIIIPWLPRRR